MFRRKDMTPNRVPRSVRLAKHALFQFLPGRIGVRNQACLHHLRRKSAADIFLRAVEEVRPGDLLIDCGANVGAVSSVFAKTGARVHAFEPDPWSFEQLSRKLEGFRNVELHKKAVGTEDGTIRFYRSSEFDADPESLSLASSVNRRAGTAQEALEVQMIDLVKFIDSLDAEVGILKIDIEGAEVPLLERLFESACLQRIRYIFVETHELQFPELLERTASLRRRAERIEHAVVNLDWH
jgi:FkbM family methyltransferase